MTRYDDLLGKPYVRGANGPDEYDCGGVVAAFLERLLGRKVNVLRGLPDDTPEDLVRRQGQGGGLRFVQVPSCERVGDVLVSPAAPNEEATSIHVSVLVDATMKRYLTAVRAAGTVLAHSSMLKPISCWRPQP